MKMELVPANVMQTIFFKNIVLRCKKMGLLCSDICGNCCDTSCLKIPQPEIEDKNMYINENDDAVEDGGEDVEEIASKYLNERR